MIKIGVIITTYEHKEFTKSISFVTNANLQGRY